MWHLQMFIHNDQREVIQKYVLLRQFSQKYGHISEQYEVLDQYLDRNTNGKIVFQKNNFHTDCSFTMEPKSSHN